ncbi:hypothetical protein [Exiguobacterium sp. s146]|uniref:GreA/GreB family elongation factor n=1 Tax=Exiguobacterium sp. s146 TaxID=2751223 RepID=UPI001BEC33A0|nr:hypothetical protein [Exiguobacterium sp. s146]
MHRPQLTTAGRLRLQEQLETLRGDSRREALERVKTARKFCDFREDVTYVEAVREQERIETKIIELERLLADAVIVDADRTITKRPVHPNGALFVVTYFSGTRFSSNVNPSPPTS